MFLHASLGMKPERWCLWFGFKFPVEQLALLRIYIWFSPDGFINIQRVPFCFYCAFGAGEMIQWVEALAEQARTHVRVGGEI